MKNKFLLPVLAILFLTACGPVARFTYSGERTAPARLQFSNQSEKATNYLWDFGDGATSTETSPTHRYLKSGNYLVQLKAIDGRKEKVTKERIAIDAPEVCLVQLETPYGNMLIELFDATPLHRDNFTRLAEEGFFDGLLFHRVIEGFMIQGGDPDSRDAKPGQSLGSGGPGYTIPAEFIDSLVHIRGALAAARQGDAVNPQKKSSGSQFYIVQGRPVTETDLNQIEARKDFRYTSAQREAYLELGGTPFLDRDYTVFGRVIEGMDVIDQIAAATTDRANRPESDIKMKIRLIN